MLYKNQLFNIENYTTLMQYLAIGESIIINNGLVNLEIYMKDVYDIKAQNLNLSQTPPYNYNSEIFHNLKNKKRKNSNNSKTGGKK